MLKLQVLVATMHLADLGELYQRMHLKTDAIFINQDNTVDYKRITISGADVECYTFHERGLSKSRNNALMRSTGDIVCIADDDMVFSDTYEEDILNEFEKHPEADAIVFNVDSTVKSREARRIESFARVGLMESREYGSVHIAFRRKAVQSRNVYFNILFGSGAVYSCGEDTIFLKDLLTKGLKLYKSPINIGIVDMSESSWFKGYDEKYFFNKGALIAYMYPVVSNLLILIQSFRNAKKLLGSYSHFTKLLKWYSAGIRDYMQRFK